MHFLTITNAKTQSFSDTGGFFDGLSAEQVNSALAGCDAIGELILRRKYLDPKETGKGYLELYRRAVTHLKKRNKLPKRLDVLSIIAKLVDLYLLEDTQANICPTCKGRADQSTNKTYVVDRRGIRRVCRRCGGSGQITWIDKERAQQLSVKSYTYSRVYKPMYLVMQDYLNPMVTDCENKAIWHINKRLQR